jgi:[ribosomal protein S5]-alanine N-acetyltransferase
MNIPSIETTHLLLRGWTPGDAGVLFNILQEEDILRYFPNPAPPSRDKAGDYISRQLANWEQFGYGHWAVVTREDDQVAGWCGLEHLAELDETEVAYLLSKRAWGRGFATEAARAAVRFGFETAGLEQIIGLVHPENAGSVRVLEKCGLRFADRITLWGMEMSRYRVNHAAFESDRLSQGHHITAAKTPSVP